MKTWPRVAARPVVAESPLGKKACVELEREKGKGKQRRKEEEGTHIWAVMGPEGSLGLFLSVQLQGHDGPARAVTAHRPKFRSPSAQPTISKT
ncbi:unnamed protein product [Urochloa humidicola]